MKKFYFYNIICNHIFSDGNKRTGLAVALVFLVLNGYQLKEGIVGDVLFNFVTSVASGQITLDECRNWFKNNIEPI